MEKKIISILVLSIFLLSSLSATLLYLVPTVHAQELSISGNDSSDINEIEAEVSSSFVATEDVIGGGLTVLLPTDFTLFYNEETEMFECKETIGAKGIIENGKKLQITAPKTITYKHEEDAEIDVEGKIIFGEDGTEFWTKEQLKNSIEEPDERDITVSVDKNDIFYDGNYNANVFFEINLVDE